MKVKIEEIHMKKVYEAPELEVELYTLDASIASNCDIVVNNGPQMGTHDACSNYSEPFSLYSRRTDININFYEDTNCDCYTTGDNGYYWTS